MLWGASFDQQPILPLSVLPFCKMGQGHLICRNLCSQAPEGSSLMWRESFWQVALTKDNLVSLNFILCFSQTSSSRKACCSNHVRKRGWVKRNVNFTLWKVHFLSNFQIQQCLFYQDYRSNQCCDRGSNFISILVFNTHTHTHNLHFEKHYGSVIKHGMPKFPQPA